MRKAIPTLAVSVFLCGALMTAGQAAGTPANNGDNGGPSVALVTGDRVVLGPPGSKVVMPVAGEGRAGMRFSILQERDHTYVIPADAAPLVAGGKLDRQLFDVTMLARDGYGERADLPLIVQGGGAAMRSPAGAHDVRPLPVIDGAAVRIRQGDNTFWRSVVAGEMRKIWLDAKLRLLLDRSVGQIGAPDAWQAGYTGAGVTVAVLDSGVDASHPDLAGKISARKNFTTEPDTDLSGHGTHVASTVASIDSKYRGVAPGASLLVGKVCERDGACDRSAVLAAMEWASTEQHAKVVNMSLGGPDEPGISPEEEAVSRLTARNGTLFVLGAGNNGPGEQTVADPSIADAALSVGAVDRDDAVAAFSGRGPRIGDYAVKPDVTAPGVGIVAARSTDGDLGNIYDTHMPGTGTSMSSPHAAGAAALLFSAHPDWTPAQIKAALMASAKPTAGASAFDQGAGRIDLTQAITQKVLPEQPSLSFGKARWPHSDDQPVTRTLTYRNTGTTDVALTLAVPATGPDGKPARTFTLSATALTVPAGGTASVEVTADTRGEGPDGNYTGQVVATGTGTTVRTPVAVVREVRSHDLTVTALGRDGKPTATFGGMLMSYDGFTDLERTVNPDGTMRLRGPAGRYALVVDVSRGEDERDGVDLFVAPWLDLSADRAVTVDARTSKPVTITVERGDAAQAEGVLGFVMPQEGGGGFVGYFTNTPALSRTGAAQIGPDAPKDRFFGAQRAVFAVPGPDQDFMNSPYVYNLAWLTPGKAYTGSRRVRDADLARVRTESLPQGAGDFAIKDSVPAPARLPDAMLPGRPGLLTMNLPHTREELFSTEDLTWTNLFYQGTRTGLPRYNDAVQVTLGRTYRPGRYYTERWNGGAVFGPSLPGLQPWASQVVDRRLVFQAPLFGTAADTVGESTLDTAHTIVHRDGTRVCESAAITCSIPGTAPRGRYRVAIDATRSLTDTSTKISLVWDVDHDGTPALPVQVVRFTPNLDAANSAPGNRVVAVPVSVGRNPGATPATLASLTVDVSYDDGATWHKAPVSGGKIRLHHPASGYVSLRAKATDTAGNTVEQTISHAYRLR